MTERKIAAAEEKLGYVFSDKSLLEQACTHSSYVNIHGGESNERPEFLGDAVIELIVSQELYNRRGEDGKPLTEKEMTELRQKAVSQKALTVSAEKLGLKECLLYEGGEGNVAGKTLSNLFEALAAAIYLDGGLQAAKKFVLDNFVIIGEVNYKGQLQEFLQNRGSPLPCYLQTDKSGADNLPEYTVRAEAEGESATGRGRNKTSAEQLAAKGLLAALMKKYKK